MTTEQKTHGKAIFWDFHGTLALPRHMWSESVFGAAEEASASLLDFSLEDVKPYTQAKWYPWDRYDEDFSALTGEKWWAFMYAELERIYGRLGLDSETAKTAARGARKRLSDPKRYALYTDAEETLRKCLKAGWKNILLSNHIPELPDIVRALGIEKLFSAEIVSSLVGYDKPRREIFEIAKRAAGGPEICVMVGDNPLSDIAGGKAAQMFTILVHNPILKNHMEPDFCAETLTEIPEILQKITEKT